MAPLPCSARRLAAVALVLAAAVPSGCGPKPNHAQTPQVAVDSYAQALDEGRTADAYAFLSAETRQTISLNDFERLLAENPAEVERLVASLRTAGADADVRATIRTPEGATLEMLYENGAWKLKASAVELYPQTSPGAALKSFCTAYEKKRWDILLRFVPTAQRDGLDENTLEQAWEGEQKAEIDMIVAGLRLALDASPIEVVGDRAAISYAGGGTAELVLEDGVWRIADFSESPAPSDAGGNRMLDE